MAAPRPDSGEKPERVNRVLDELGKEIGRDFAEPHHRPGFVEGPPRANHLLHQRRLGAGEDVADLPLLLHGGSERLLHAAAVETADRLELVEGDRQPAIEARGDPRRQDEDLLRQPGRVARRPDAGKRDRQAGTIGVDAQLRLGAGEHVAQPAAGASRPGVERGQGPRVALEERDVRTEAADGDFERDDAIAREADEGLADQRRLAVAARRNQEDFLAVSEVGGQTVELGAPADERGPRDDLAVDEGVLWHGHT